MVFCYFSSVVAENWKARQATIAMEWGTTGFEDEERERAEYEGVEISSPVDGQPMLYYSSSNQFIVRTFINVSAYTLIILNYCNIYLQNFFFCNESRL